MFAIAKKHVLILQVRHVPGSTYFVDPGTTFRSENVVLTIFLNQTRVRLGSP